MDDHFTTLVHNSSLKCLKKEYNHVTTNIHYVMVTIIIISTLIIILQLPVPDILQGAT